ncbi:MAG: NAD-dependent protein deacetylase of SIR2 family [Pseudomonadales bacterium]|nr:NAD-dependent protein deacetylase of SIR2 family [Pseudomonadales bacterium]
MNPITEAANILAEANAVLIGAGAGLSAAAGLDYTDEIRFAARFPAMLQYGARNQYQLMGYPFADEALKWGYLAATLDDVYGSGVTQVYQDLLTIVDKRDYFVMTSNVDRYFHKNGFVDDRIYTPQGDYELLQCQTPCHRAVWDAKPIVAALVEHIDPQTQKVTDSSLLPVCPNCGENVYMNVRGGDWFIDAPYVEQANAISLWLDRVRHERLAVLEIGAGFNTPGVIRGPMETIGTTWPNADFIRVNIADMQAPAGTVCVAEPADRALQLILQQLTQSS